MCLYTVKLKMNQEMWKFMSEVWVNVSDIDLFLPSADLKFTNFILKNVPYNNNQFVVNQ